MGLKKFSPKRIILDNELKTNIKSYVFKTANKENTIFFYNEAKKSKIFKFKQHKITLIKSAIDSNKRFNLSIILKKLYNLNCRNILVEGGNNLTSSFIKDMIFNQFFLFEGSKNLSKSCEFLEFKDFGLLKKKYKKRLKIKSNFGKDVITLYKK
jgi:diaminohydroxyphosphoribosylaminopyrimidine deaminase/5-amino-6-(5-phosphoribosylamino)uracil reductase